MKRALPVLILLAIVGFGFFPAAAEPKHPHQIDEGYTLRIHNNVPQSLPKAYEKLTEGNPSEAAKLLHHALERPLSERNTYIAYNNLCIAYHLQGAHRLAIEQCWKAINLRRGRWQAWHNLGVAYMALGEWKHAIKAFETGLAITPENIRLKNHLESAQEQLKPNLRPRHEVPDPVGCCHGVI